MNIIVIYCLFVSRHNLIWKQRSGALRAVCQANICITWACRFCHAFELRRHFDCNDKLQCDFKRLCVMHRVDARCSINYGRARRMWQGIICFQYINFNKWCEHIIYLDRDMMYFMSVSDTFIVAISYAYTGNLFLAKLTSNWIDLKVNLILCACFSSFFFTLSSIFWNNVAVCALYWLQFNVRRNEML